VLATASWSEQMLQKQFTTILVNCFCEYSSQIPTCIFLQEFANLSLLFNGTSKMHKVANSNFFKTAGPVLIQNI